MAAEEALLPSATPRLRILMLVHGFNSLSQRLHVELAARGHVLSVEYDIHDSITLEAVELFRPDVVLAPYLKRAIPEAIWRNLPCLVVHPGIPGDRGPAALDRAILERRSHWGVSVLQAVAEFDAGPIWAHRSFPMREAPKASLYRREVTGAAVEAVLEALTRLAAGWQPEAQHEGLPGRAHRPVSLAERTIDWASDRTADVLRKIHSADGYPGVRGELAGVTCRLYDAHPEHTLRGAPGELLARRGEAVCRATVDGAVWIGHVRREDDHALKLPATQALAAELAALTDLPELPEDDDGLIVYREADGVGWIDFPFHNGAMGTPHCRRLAEAVRTARSRGVRVLVLTGGPEFWSNGIHLNLIEAADSPADASMHNIEAMDDLVAELLECRGLWLIAALRGNAGAGGCFLALAADEVLAHDGVVLNPHYRNMGNLYGSEYWTYLLPKRVGEDGVAHVLDRRLPLGAHEAAAIGLIDGCIGPAAGFMDAVDAHARAVAADPDFERLIAAKLDGYAADEREKPLAVYRAEELERMRLNFYGFDPSYHVARHAFVHRRPQSWTPLHLAIHRRRTPPQPS